MKKIILFTLLVVLTVLGYLKTYKPEILAPLTTTKTEEILPEIIVVEEKEDAVSINENKFIPKVNFDDNTRTFAKKELETNCTDDPAICAVDLAVKCSINPTLDFCDKKKLPRFIFMEDPSLGRPTYIHYKVLKIHPIDAKTVEVQTESQCDGLWFGLCNGNIIYVINKEGENWKVKDLYALESY